MSELKEISSGKSEKEMEIEMLELCIVICGEHNDLEQIKKIEVELAALRLALNATNEVVQTEV